jgi:hypothetical protein
MPAKKKVITDAEQLAEQEQVAEVDVERPQTDITAEAIAQTKVADTPSPSDAAEESIDDSAAGPDDSDPDTKTTKAGKRSAKAIREAAEEAGRLAAKDERAEEPEPVQAARQEIP